MDKYSKKNEKHYDVTARDYANKHRYPDEKMYLALPYLKKGMKILDLGCGHGRFLDLVPKGVDYVGLDISSGLLAIASKRYPQAKFIKADMTGEKVWQKIGKFDAIFALAIYHHLMNKKTQQKVTKLVYDSLNKNGLFMVTVLNFFKKDGWIKNARKVSGQHYLVPWKLSDGQKTIKTVQRNFYAFKPEELRKLLKAAGFKIEKQFFTYGKSLSDAKEFGIVARKLGV